jgi:hypothetical protein
VVFALWLVVTTAIQRSGRHPLAFVVLAGTFALAMAFASNDLVNFVGVPLAGLASWRAWSASGADPELFLMEALKEPVRGDTIYLLGAGLVMAITLWLSSKARSVTQTGIDLSRQDEGAERFKPGPVSRGLVRAFIATGESVRALTPPNWQTEIARRFAREERAAELRNAPAFDLVRASVNLAVASILIAIATSFKLPLSTTFVGFMVAMGSSLADRAWGRDSAAYRVAGVLSVLTGWFVTAAAAFLLAAFVAVLLSTFGEAALLILVGLVAFILYRSFRYHATRTEREERSRARDSSSFEHQVHLLSDQVSEVLSTCSDSVAESIHGLLEGDRGLLDRARKRIDDLEPNLARKELVFVRVLKRVRPEIDDRLLGHLEILACQQDLYQTVDTIVEMASNHVFNAHAGLTPEVAERLGEFNHVQKDAVDQHVASWRENRSSDRIADDLASLERLLTQVTEMTVGNLYQKVRPVKFTTLLLTILTELADFVRELDRLNQLRQKYIARAAG